MCTGPRIPTSQNPSLLLELAASNDVSSLKHLIEIEGQDVNSPALWYCRHSVGSDSDPRMGFAARTPLMIAALFANLDALAIILSLEPDVNRRSDTDGSTALHLAASADAARILIDAGADADAVDNRGRRPGDVIARQAAKCLDGALNDLRGAVFTASMEGEEQNKKKGYQTLPDIKCGVYGTDEFRMYAFKVKPCSRAYSHDWTECPFVHPGENARRRDPRKYTYSCVPCPEFRKGSCRKEDGCEYAHGVFESWLHPAQYRTRLCKDEVGCSRRVCFFAHKLEELRSVSNFDIASVGLPSPTTAPSSPGAWMNQQKHIDQIQNSASPRSNYGNLYGSSQSLSGYHTSILSTMSGLDISMAKAILSSRAVSFAQRSQSFIDRKALPCSPVTTSAQSMGLSNWGSPDGKLDWGIQGEELNKFRKSASFATRNSSTISPPREVVLEAPDLSWVQALVKDGTANEPKVGRGGFDQKHQQYQMFGGQMFSPWGEEQIVN